MNTIVGRITKNAEINTLKNDKKVVNFSIAINDSYKNQRRRTQRIDHLLQLLLLDKSECSQNINQRKFGGIIGQDKFE